jgi:hypothetical protein
MGVALAAWVGRNRQNWLEAELRTVKNIRPANVYCCEEPGGGCQQRVGALAVRGKYAMFDRIPSFMLM